MNFLDHDFDHLTQNDENYKKNFQDQTNCVARYTLLYHCLKNLSHVKNQINKLPPGSKGLKPENLQQIRAEDTSVTLSKMIS